LVQFSASQTVISKKKRPARWRASLYLHFLFYQAEQNYYANFFGLYSLPHEVFAKSRGLTAFLEADGGAKGDAQVVVRTIANPDLVACFKADAKWAGEQLQTGAGVGRKVRGVIAKVAEGAGKAGAGWRVVGIAVLDKAGLGSDEAAHRARGADLELGSKEAGERAQVAGDGGAGGGGSAAGGEGVGEVLLKVVVHLRLKLGVGMHVHADPAAEAEEVDRGRAGGGDAIEVAIDSQFYVVQRGPIVTAGHGLGVKRAGNSE